jgi:hypothetical protein
MNEDFSNKNIIDDSQNIYFDESPYAEQNAEQMLKEMGYIVPAGMSASTALELLLDGVPPEEIFRSVESNSHESYEYSKNHRSITHISSNISDIEISNISEFLIKFTSVRAGAFRHYGKTWKDPIGSLKNFRNMHEILMSLVSHALEDARYFQKPFPIIPTAELCDLYKKIFEILKLYPEEIFFDQNFYEFAQLNFQIFETQANIIQDIKANIRVIPNLVQDLHNTVELCTLMLKTAYLCYTILTKENVEKPLHRPAATHLADIVTQSTHIFLSIFDRHNEIDTEIKMSIKESLTRLMKPIDHRDSIACLMNLEELIINFSDTIKAMAELIASLNDIVQSDNNL